MSVRTGITSLVVTIALLTSAVSVLATPVLSQVTDQPFYDVASYSYDPQPAIAGTPTTLYVTIEMVTQASTTSPAPAGTPVYFSIPNLDPIKAYTDSNGRASITHTFDPGTYTIRWSTPSGGNIKSQTVTVVAATTPTAAPTATATPQATVPKSTLTPTSAPQATTIINVYVPPTTVINQVIPGTVTQGTGPWENPRVTVKNPGPDKLRTTILDFAKNPEENTAHYDEQVKAANADGWTLSARGEKTYGDASKDYRYSRFTKGTSTLLFAAQGNNSTEKNYDIPGDVLITETEETFAASATTSIGSLLGLPGFEAVYAVAGLLAVAYVVMRHRK